MAPPTDGDDRTSAIVITDAQGLTTWVNAEFEARTGWTLAEMRGRTPGSLLAGASTPEEPRRLMREAVQRGVECRDIDTINQRKDGSAYATRIDIEPQFDPRGRLLGFVSQQRERAPLATGGALRPPAAEWFELLRHDAAVGLFEHAEASGESLWDGTARALLGLRPADTASPPERLRRGVHPDDRPALEAALRRARAGHGVQVVELRFGAEGRALRRLELRCAVVRDVLRGRVTIGALRDVQAEAAERERRASAEWQRQAAIGLAHVGLLRRLVGRDRVEADAEARRIFGLPASGELDAESVYAAIHEDDREAVAGAWQQLADGDVAQDEIRYRVRHAGGRIVHVQSRRQRREFGDGGVEVIGAVFDIGEQVRSAALAMQQRQLEAERDRASALAAARTALLAAVSHELRTPLNAIVVASEQLALHAGADEPWIRLLHEASQHLHGLAEDLLEGITLEQRITAEPVEVLDLHEKVDRAARWLAGTAAITGVVIEVDEGLRGRRVQAPRRRLRQVLLNLVGNAVKYNRPGGHVRCTAEVEPSGGMVLLHIRDDGPGMTPEQLDLLFRPFERLGRENGAVHGFGLGLFLVQRFVQEMGGRVGVHSEPGRGTTVTLALPPASADAGREAGAADEAAHGEPLAGMPAASPPRATPAPVPHEGPIHLLCLDDDPFTGTVLAAQLERIGRFELHAVRTLEAALAALAAMQGRGASPDLLLVDLHLGPLTGPQALEALRAAGCATAAVAYTGAADPVAQRSAERAGFAEVWVKPVGTPALREALERVLPGRGLERAAGGGGEPA